MFINGFYHFHLTQLELMHRAEFIFLHLQSTFISQHLSLRVISICTVCQLMTQLIRGWYPAITG